MSRVIVWAVLLAVVLAHPALSAESAGVVSPRATATLISERDSVTGAPFRVGLRLRMAPGWHTYWQNPGDAGVAAELAFDLPPGATSGPIQWPTPQRQPEGPLMTYGYSGELVLPVTITPPAETRGLAVKLHASWLVCEKICVPEEGDFQLDLPSAPTSSTVQPSPEAALFAAADLRMPRRSPWQATISPSGVLTVAGESLARGAVQDAWFFPATPDQIENPAAQLLTVHDGGFSLSLKPGAAFKPTSRQPGVLVVVDRSGAQSFLAIDATPGPALFTDDPNLSMAGMLGFAVLGGLLLNLMPCVFPILAMKSLALARLSGTGRREAWRQAAGYAAGVMLTFAALGAALMAARAAGDAAGWGFQFQSPVAVALMAWVLFGVGLNLSGVLEVGGSFSGIGQSLAGRGGWAGSFFTGTLAVLVATPCTAPFMGAAIAAAMAAPPAATLAVFLAMGAGLAAPYVLLATLPGAARALPRPGAWMDVLKQALAFPMYAACVWLLWVVAQQSGPDGVLAVSSGLVLLGLAGWATGRAHHQGRRTRRVAAGTALVCLALMAATLAELAASPGLPAGLPAGVAAPEAGIEPFSPARLAALRAAGRPVFVNMTAAWCVTCLVNERLALSGAAVRDAFAAHHVAYLKGDWTRQNPEITAYLRAQGRDGVPLYVLYPAGGGAPETLPQILTESTMLQHLDSAGG